MKYVPAMSTNDNRAVFGSPTIFLGFSAVVLKLQRDGDNVLFLW